MHFKFNLHPLIRSSLSRTREDFIFIAQKPRNTSSYEPETLLNTLMNTIAIDENSANEVIGYFYAENQDENIRLAINEKCHEKTNFSQGKGFLFYMLLIMIILRYLYELL